MARNAKQTNVSMQNNQKKEQKKKPQKNKRNRKPKASKPSNAAPAAILPLEIKTHARHAIQFLDPARFGATVLIPDRSSKVRCTRRFQKIIEIDSSQAGCEDGFTVVARPDARLPFALSGPTTTNPVGAGNFFLKGHVRVKGLANHSNDGDSFKVTSAQATTIGRAKWDAAAGPAGLFTLGVHTVAVVNSNDSQINAYLTSNSIYPRVSFYRKVGGVWTLIYAGSPDDKSPMSVAIGSYILEDIGFCFDSVASTDTELRYTINIGATDSGYVDMTTQIDLTRGEFVEEFQDIAEGGRLTGMSILVTNTSPDLANGGSIYAARVPSDVPYFTTPGAMLGKCPRMYRGDAAHGAYTWWLPSEEKAQTYLDMIELEQQLSDDNYLWIQLKGWGGANTSSAIITVTWAVEFYAESQLYEKLVPPFRDQAWDDVLATLYRLPEASCNPDHAQLFKSFLQAAKESFGKASAHYGRHKALYDGLMKAFLA